MRRSIASVLGDAGGAEALAPVLAMLAREGSLGTVFASAAAEPVAERFALPRIRIDGARTTTDTARQVLEAGEPTALLASTSWGSGRVEPPFLEAARLLGIPTISVIDFWSSYRERFAGADGIDLVLPDRIAVMDARAREEAVAAGLPEDLLVVTGNPHHEALIARYAGWNRDRRLAFRERTRLPRAATIVLFASQPIEALYGSTIGYTEGAVLALVSESLRQVARWLGHPILLVIRPHPRGGRLAVPADSPDLGIRFAMGEDPIAWCLAADLVVGMTSALLFDTALLGGRAVSVQPGLVGPDRLPSNRMDLSDGVYDPAEVPAALYRALARPLRTARLTGASRLRAAAHGAATRLLDLVDSMSVTMTGGAR